MSKTLFTIDTLGDLDDGTTRLVVDQALADALSDCDNRPNLDKPRRVLITVDTTTDDNGGIVLELTTVLNTLRAAERAALDNIVDNLKTALPKGVPIYHAVVK